MGSCFSRPVKVRPLLPVVVEDRWEQMNKVFQNDLLLDLILTNVLLNPVKKRKRNATFSNSEACVLRQVCRRWMLTVSCLFLRDRQPLLHLRVGESTSKKLQSLMKGFGRYAAPSFFGSLPPFSLSLEEASRYNCFLFETLMIHLGGASTLVHLRIRDRFFFKDNFCLKLPPNLKFDMLHTVTLIVDWTLKHPAKFVARFNSFTQDILDRTVDLRDLSHKAVLCFSLLPVDIIIPQTVTHLQIETLTEIFDKQNTIPLLLQPPLLQLKSLQVGVNTLKFGEDLYKFLAGVRQSLEHLCLKSVWIHDQLQMDMTRMPVFPRLRSFSLQGQLFMMVGQTGSGDEPKCPSVQFLTMLLEERVGTRQTPVSLDTMFGIRSNFPQVAHMTVTITRTCIAGLGNLFSVMGDQLRTLTIRYGDQHHDLFVSSLEWDQQDAWDAVFLGTTPEIVTTHRWRPNKLRGIVNRKENVKRSVRNLGNLEELSVIGWHFNDQEARIGLELCFRFGFMEMPKLKQLTVGRSFAVLKKTEQNWEQMSGRSVEINDRLDC